ncbi:hypothetical protein ABPG75_010656 [Micractinium tetrahymenae]
MNHTTEQCGNSSYAGGAGARWRWRLLVGLYDWERRQQGMDPWMPQGPGPVAPLAAAALANVAAACEGAHAAASAGPSPALVELRRFLLVCAHTCLAPVEGVLPPLWGDALVGPAHPAVRPLMALALREAATPRPPGADPRFDYDSPPAMGTWLEGAVDVLLYLSARALAASQQGSLVLKPLKPLIEAVPPAVLSKGVLPVAALVASVRSSH